MGVMLVDLPREAVLRPGFWATSPPVRRRERPVRSVGEALRPPEGLWVQALAALRNCGDDELGYDDWRNVVFAIHHETGGSDAGLQLAHEFSARSSKYDPAFLDERVWPYVRDREGGVSIGGGTVMSLAARLHGWRAPLSGDEFPVLDQRGKVVSDGSRNRGDGDISDGAGSRGGAGVRSGVAGVDAGRVARPVGSLPVAAPHAARAGEALEGDERTGEERGHVAHGGVSAGVHPSGQEVATLAEPVERDGVPAAKHLCTDQANAVRLVKAYGSRVLVAGGRWHVWDGVRWKADEADVYRYAMHLSEMVKEEARAVVARARQASEGDGSGERIARAEKLAEALEKWSVKCEMKGTIEAAVGLARKTLTVDVDLLDRDPWLLNVRNGVVDLRDGSLRPHRADDYMTKLVDVDYDPRARAEESAEAKEWGAVLAQIVPDEKVRAFLQRWFGYCLTGWTREQVFVVHWGDGSNGKSTVLDLMARTMGDYAGVAAPGLVASSGDKSERHPTEVAALVGRRMVTAHETREGVALREDFIKQATGDDVMTARFMREDFFDFRPSHKIQLLTNHKPVIKGQDKGIWRRVLLVAYEAVFGSAEDVVQGRATAVRDLGVAERFGSPQMRRAVLAWRVRGAAQWAQEGLRPPDVVLDASARYRGESDRVLQFVRECCELQPSGAGSRLADGREGEASNSRATWAEPLTLGMGGVYPCYKSWCADAGYLAMSRQRFVTELLRTCPELQVAETYGKGESGARRKILQVRGLRLLPEG